MKPVYETERRSNNRWILPFALGAFAITLMFAVAGFAKIQQALAAQQPAAGPGREPVLIDDTDVRAAKAVVKWEYTVKQIHVPNAKKSLDAVGMEGWELVSVAVLPGQGGSSGQQFAYFKRPQSDAAAVVVPALPPFSPNSQPPVPPRFERAEKP